MFDYEFTVHFRDINFFIATKNTRYFDKLSDLLFSPYVPTQLIPVGVEWSNGTPSKDRQTCPYLLQRGNICQGSGADIVYFTV